MSLCCLSCSRCVGAFPLIPRLLQILWVFPEPPSHAQEHLSWSLGLFRPTGVLPGSEGVLPESRGLSGPFQVLQGLYGRGGSLQAFPECRGFLGAPRPVLPCRAVPQTREEHSGSPWLAPAPPPRPAGLFSGRLRGSLRSFPGLHREPAFPWRRLGVSP